MSLAFPATAVTKALLAAEEFLGGNLPWEPSNTQQADWLNRQPGYAGFVNRVPEIEARANTDIPAINAWLKERGFNISVDPSGNFAVAAISDIAVEWKQAGDTKPYDGHAGFYLEKGVSIMQHPKFAYPHVSISTKSGDIVTIVESEAPATLDAVAEARTALKTAYDAPYGELIAPMVNLDVQPDISWFVGLSRGAFAIEDAVAQSRFGMNHLGARAKEAVAFGFESTSMPDPAYIITHPFLIWIDRPSLSDDPAEREPIFQAYISPDVWCDPGDLSKL
jgi:hypothetical protein